MSIVNTSTQYRFTGKGPLDTRALVPTYADLLAPATWETDNGIRFAYNGMIVAVWCNTSDTSKNGIYFLQDPLVTTGRGKPDFTNEANWHKLAEVSELAAISAKLPTIDELAERAQNLEYLINGSDEYEGLTATVAKNTAAIAAVTSMSTKIVDTVPSVDDAKLGVIYLVADEKASGNYIEYILVDDGEVKTIEQIGSTAINLDNYVTADELTTTLDSYAKASNVVTLSAFEEFKTSTDADILKVAEETAKKADVIALESYYKISAADAKFVSTEAFTAALDSKADKETTYTKSEVNDIQATLIAQVDTVADNVAKLITATEANAAKLAGISTTVAQAIEEAIQTIPALEVATAEKLGGIKTGSGDNAVTVDDAGVASVESVNINTLHQDDGDILVLNGGNTSDVI